jgi:hypothetical protein
LNSTSYSKSSVSTNKPSSLTLMTAWKWDQLYKEKGISFHYAARKTINELEPNQSIMASIYTLRNKTIFFSRRNIKRIRKSTSLWGSKVIWGLESNIWGTIETGVLQVLKKRVTCFRNFVIKTFNAETMKIKNQFRGMDNSLFGKTLNPFKPCRTGAYAHVMSSLQ